MSNTNDGGQAFPCMYPNASNMGMTLRDYFAAKAMQSILSTLNQGMRRVDIPLMARDAYGIADAMLEAREARSNP